MLVRLLLLELVWLQVLVSVFMQLGLMLLHAVLLELRECVDVMQEGLAEPSDRTEANRERGCHTRETWRNRVCKRMLSDSGYHAKELGGTDRENGYQVRERISRERNLAEPSERKDVK